MNLMDIEESGYSLKQYQNFSNYRNKRRPVFIVTAVGTW
jgi:hypothetical protein